jgi:tRNA-splicing ligase RtcB
MDLSLLQRQSDVEWVVVPFGKMRVPAIIYATETLVRDMDPKVYEQVANVATLPGIIRASYAMPDAHWGYGFPIGGVAAFDPELGGVVSAGGVGFDISCGVRTLHTGLSREAIQPVQARLADTLFRTIPAGLGPKQGARQSAQSVVFSPWGEPLSVGHFTPCGGSAEDCAADLDQLPGHRRCHRH